jgi:hypothetical protein
MSWNDSIEVGERTRVQPTGALAGWYSPSGLTEYSGECKPWAVAGEAPTTVCEGARAPRATA